VAKRKVAEVIVDTLRAAGVKRCYGVVGDTLNQVTDAIRRSDMEWVHMRHEEAGALAAGAEAYMTGELTACAGSCGRAACTSSMACSRVTATALRSC
jgi:pyruvate dehydrogenase (quinone)